MTQYRAVVMSPVEFTIEAESLAAAESAVMSGLSASNHSVSLRGAVGGKMHPTVVAIEEGEAAGIEADGDTGGATE